MTGPLGIAVAVSHLFADADVCERMRRFADAYELRDHHGPREFVTDRPVLFHVEASILTPVDVDAIARRVEVYANQGRLRIVSLHALSCYTEPRLEGRAFQPGGRRMAASEMIDCAASNREQLVARLGGDVIIAAENNNALPTPAYDMVTDALFLGRMVAESRVELLLDLGHAAISARHHGVSLDAYVAALPSERVVQLHVAGIGRVDGQWTDDHVEPIDEDWAALGRWLPRLPTLQFVTIEYYRDVDRLLRLHERLVSFVDAINTGRGRDARPEGVSA